MALHRRLAELQGKPPLDLVALRAQQDRYLEHAPHRPDAITWERFSEGIKPSTAGYQEARQHFRELANAVARVLGDGQQVDPAGALAAVLAASRKARERFKEGAAEALVTSMRPMLGGGVVSTEDAQRITYLQEALDSFQRTAGGTPGVVHAPFGESWHVQPPRSWPDLPLHRAHVEAVRQLLAADDGPRPGSGAGPQAQALDAPKGSVLWLRRAVQAHVDRPGAAPGVDGEMTAASIVRMLHSDASNDMLQGDLLDLVGFEGLDLVAELLSQREAIGDSALELCDIVLGEEGAVSSTSPAGSAAVGGAGGGGTRVTITSTSSQRAERARRKDQRRVARRAHGVTGVGQVDRLLSQVGLDAALQLATEAAAAVAQASAATSAGPSGATGTLFQQTALPEGTARDVYNDYEMVSVPPPAQDPESQARIAARPRVPVRALDPLLKVVLAKVETLNTMQTQVHKCALYSAENMLVCAPTGAGKTNVAVMTIVQHLRGCLRADGSVDREHVRIVYVAPMKALAAEVAGKLSAVLRPLGLAVREFTGDMQLTRKEVSETQLFVTTPEKWDVITRKGSESIVSNVGLMILDEVHLLHDDRGPVIEALVARTLRLVEAAQVQVRLVGLSATLPNYVDVALFLRVNPKTGLFFFDSTYRPVPLSQQYIGVKVSNPFRRLEKMLELTYERVLQCATAGQQCMVFVHARNDTVRTARALRDLARSQGDMATFAPEESSPRLAAAQRDLAKCRTKDLPELFAAGLGVHHAGMLRSDRALVERLFSEGLLRCLVCTATLAWGVNLPAHMVIIKGTQIYNPQKGAHVELSPLDVMQIFGRAGRPQFDTSGEGVIITTHDKLAHYLKMLNSQLSVESQLSTNLADHLNAEVALGTVSSVAEGAAWLSYTYLFVRACRSPLTYGISAAQRDQDPDLLLWRHNLIRGVARQLDKARMVRFNPGTGAIDPTEIGRIASHFYLGLGTVDLFDDTGDEDKSDRRLHPLATDAEVLAALARSTEFENIKVRDEEQEELGTLLQECPLKVKGGLEEAAGKVNVLIQTYISGLPLRASALASDQNFIAQSAGRITRGFFEIALSKGWIGVAVKALNLAKMLDHRLWTTSTPLRQVGGLTEGVFERLEATRSTRDRLLDMSDDEVGALIRHPRQGSAVRACARRLPILAMSVGAKPITRAVLRVEVSLRAAFDWSARVHGSSQAYYVWVEDFDDEHVYHKERFVLPEVKKHESHLLAFTIPLFEPLPPQYLVRVVSEHFMGCDTVVPLPLSELRLPSAGTEHTTLLDLRPLPRAALAVPEYEELFRFSHFNPVQTQVFHTAYHTDANLLVGAPTGSGKTVAAELCILRLVSAHPGAKAVYVAPLKALVRERMADWRRKFVDALGLRLVELTGDVSPDVHALRAADIITTTPEKWDSVSRGWRARAYVRDVGLVMIDEVHLLGEERGPVLEVIVSRMRHVATQDGGRPVRFLGLTSTLANAQDLADWLGVPQGALFNFKASVRPVPLEVHISGHAGKHYCPRMAAMNKPTYRAIIQHAPDKPTLVFVSSRRQTRLTALDLISYCSADERQGQFINMDNDEVVHVVDGIVDSALRHTLAFGIGLHHAGLADSDRATVERLFVEGKILVLVSTATLAWGVNFPAHLVVVKGTEFYDGKEKRYVDYPITDVLQMMGRAGRPQFDDHGVAVVLVHEPKKNFYRRFLYEPFPVESSLPEHLHDHLNAEIAGGTIRSKQDAVDFITWTFFYRRLTSNPSFYHLASASDGAVSDFLSALVETTVSDLAAAGCVEVAEDELAVEPLPLGRVACFYYLSYKTVACFRAELSASPLEGAEDEGGDDALPAPLDFATMLRVLCDAEEFAELPVRHNEDQLNAALAQACPLPVDTSALDSSQVKAHILLQAHMCRLELPIADYVTDTKSVLDQALRVLQALVDIAADAGAVHNVLVAMRLCQHVCQASWPGTSECATLPHATKAAEAALAAVSGGLQPPPLAPLLHLDQGLLEKALRAKDVGLGSRDREELLRALRRLPIVEVQVVEPVEVAADEEGKVEVRLFRRNPPTSRRAFAPKFPKAKTEGWWLLLADGPEVLALKRVSIGRESPAHLQILAPADVGEYEYTLHVVSDCYVGLDVEVPVRVRAV